MTGKIEKRLRTTTLVLSACSALYGMSAQAADLGLSLGYNNPAQAGYGLNLIAVWKSLALEVGVGSASASSSQRKSDGNLTLSGDIDLKYLFQSAQWRPFVEGGFHTGLGAGSNSGIAIGAGNPFVGGGLMYWGSKLFGYAGANTDAGKELNPFIGIGFRF